FTRLKLQAAYLAEKNFSLQNLDGNQRRPDDAARSWTARIRREIGTNDRWRGVADGRVQRRHQGFHGGANSAGSGGGSVGGTGGSGGGCRISQAFRSALKGSDRVIEASHAQRPVGANSNWRRPERRVPCRRELDRDIDQYMSGGQSSSEDSG
uniref:FoP_duplication domain-containing protein n=1 Tax=Macrostomum lignano TaxID=282301 RepID=A0A1I8IEY8_9PLAT